MAGISEIIGKAIVMTSEISRFALMLKSYHLIFQNQNRSDLTMIPNPTATLVLIIAITDQNLKLT